MKPAPSLPPLVVSCLYKPLRSCHPSQRVSEVQCKKLAKKYFLRFYVGFLRDFMLIFEDILCFLKRFYVDALLDFMFF